MADPTLTELYLEDRGGSPSEFRQCLDEGHRWGQAFFNALSGKDQERLRGTIYDPFHTFGVRKTEEAIQWLLDTENDPDPLYLRPPAKTKEK